MKIDKVLIPLDGSTLAEQALTQALDLTKDRESTFVLMRAAMASGDSALPGEKDCGGCPVSASHSFGPIDANLCFDAPVALGSPVALLSSRAVGIRRRLADDDGLTRWPLGHARLM